MCTVHITTMQHGMNAAAINSVWSPQKAVMCRRAPSICRMAPFSGRSSQPGACTRRCAAAACAIAAGPIVVRLQHARLPLASLPGTLQQQHSCHGDRRSTASWQQQRTKRTQHAAFQNGSGGAARGLALAAAALPAATTAGFAQVPAAAPACAAARSSSSARLMPTLAGCGVAGGSLRSSHGRRMAACRPQVTAAAVSGDSSGSSDGNDSSSGGGTADNQVLTDDSHSGGHRSVGPPTITEPAQPSDAQLGAAAGGSGDAAGAAAEGKGGDNGNKVVTDDSHSGGHRTVGPPTIPEPAQPSDAQLGAATGGSGDAAGAAGQGSNSDNGNGAGGSTADDGQQSDTGEWMDTTCDEEVCSLDFGDD